MKSIREIATELGVSRQAVHQKIKKEPLSTALQGLLTSVDGALQVGVDGEKLIKAAFSKDMLSTASALSIQPVNESITETLLDLLKLELEAKGRQLESKDVQIAAMQHTIDAQAKNIEDLTETITIQAGNIKDLASSLNAAQALHAGTIQTQLGRDMITEGEASATAETVSPVDGKPFRRWWQFWKTDLTHG